MRRVRFGDRDRHVPHRHIRRGCERVGDESRARPDLVDIGNRPAHVQWNVLQFPEPVADHPLGRREEIGEVARQERELVRRHHAQGVGELDAVRRRGRLVDRARRALRGHGRVRKCSLLDGLTEAADDIAKTRLASEVADQVETVATQRIGDDQRITLDRGRGQQQRHVVDGERIATPAPEGRCGSLLGVGKGRRQVASLLMQRRPVTGCQPGPELGGRAPWCWRRCRCISNDLTHDAVDEQPTR